MSDLTQKALAAAVTKLLEEKPLDKITIKEITDTCGVTRNTFYYHYQDVYDLLSWIFINQAEEIINEHLDPNELENGFMSGLDYLYNHKKMIYHVYRSISKENLERYLHRVVGSYALELVELQAGDLEVSRDAKLIVADFYKNAFTGMVLQWIVEDMKESPHSLAVLCDSMFRGTVREALMSAEKAVKLARK